MKFFIPIALILLIILVSSNYNSNFIFPDKEEFKLTVDVSSSNIKKGETLIVNAQLTNLTRNKYTLDYEFFYRQLIRIELDKKNATKPEMSIIPGLSANITIKPKSTISTEEKIILDESGEYILNVFVNFDIVHPKSKESKNYFIKLDPIEIQVQ